MSVHRHAVLELLKWVLISRILICIIVYLTTTYLKIFDTSSQIVNYFATKTEIDRLIFNTFGGFSHLDGEHFLRIAEFGYDHEKMLHFFLDYL